MSSVRELLEAVVPLDPEPGEAPVLVRERARRRRRRGQVLGAALAVASLGAVMIVGVRVLAPADPTSSTPSTTAPSTSPSTSAPAAGVDLAALEGTRWIPDMVMTGVAPSQRYPDGTGTGPEALVVFGSRHQVAIHYREGGVTTTALGTWQATAPSPAPTLTAGGSGTLQVYVVEPPGAPDTLVRLLNRMSLLRTYILVRSDGPPSPLAPLTLFGYSAGSTLNAVTLDLVEPGASLPAGYPGRS